MRLYLIAGKYLLLGVIAVMINQCGVEIGNPKDEGSSPAKYAATDIDQGLELSQIAVDEALQAIATNSHSESSLSESLALQSYLALQNSVSCIENADGSIRTNIRLSDSQEASRGKNQERRILTEFEGNISRLFFSSDTSLECISSDTRPILAWRRLDDLSISSEFSRSSTQEVIEVSSGESLARRLRSSSGTRHQEVTKTTSQVDFIVLEESLTFDIQHTSSITKGNERIDFESQIIIEDEAPLVIERTLSRDRTQNTILIKSGTIKTLNGDQGSLILSYEDVQINPSNCRIQTGKIKGSLRLVASEKERELSFTIGLFDGEERIQFADGSQQTIDINSCLVQ